MGAPRGNKNAAGPHRKRRNPKSLSRGARTYLRTRAVSAIDSRIRAEMRAMKKKWAHLYK